MTLKLALAAAAALAVSAPAMAAPATAQIRFGDLDLSTSKGFSSLTRRIDNAADQVCGERPRSLADISANKACRDDITAQAHAKLRDQLTVAPVLVAKR